MPTRTGTEIILCILTTQIIVCLIHGIKGNAIEAEKCDISKWYTKMSSEGLFDSSMNTQQQKLHNTIQKLVVHGKNKRNVKLVDCKILEMYENEMKKGKVKATNSKSTTETLKAADNLTIIKSTENTLSHKNDITKIENPRNENIAELESQEEAAERIFRERDRESEVFADDSEIDETELDEIIDESNSDGEFDDSEKHNDNQAHKSWLDDKNQNSLVQKEILSQEQNTHDFETIETESNGTSNSKEILQERNAKDIFKYMETGGKTCRRYTWKLQKYMILKISPKEKVDSTTKEIFGYNCKISYALSPSYCLLQVKNTAMFNMTQHMSDKLEKGTASLTDNLLTPNNLGSINKNTNKIFEAGKEMENLVDPNEFSEEQEGMLIDGKFNEEIDDISYTAYSEDMLMSYNNKDLPNDAVQRSSNEENNNEYKSQQTFDRKVLEDMLSLKTEEYTKKINVLELNIIKLENQMLMEKLNKENHSSTIARLENSILRLENELLRMKQSFHHMKIENDEMKRTQRKYLELGHSSESYSLQKLNHDQLLSEQQQTIMKLSEKLQNQSNLIDNLKNRSEGLDDQNRILYAMVMNQTVLMSQIMAKVQSLTEQTLQQRETAEKMKQKLESGLEDVRELKNSQANQGLVDPATNSKESYLDDLSNQLLQQLDDLVSDKKLESGEIIEQSSFVGQLKDQDDEIDEQLKEYLHYTSITSSVKLQEWCDSSAHCFKGFIIISECAPYSPFIFANCESESLMSYSESDNEPESLEIIPRSEEKESNKTKDSETSKNVQPPDPDDRTSVQKEDKNILHVDRYNETSEEEVLKAMEKTIEELELKQSLTTKNVQNEEMYIRLRGSVVIAAVLKPPGICRECSNHAFF
ncbi:uncharacterized protein LOC134232280 [Saccostrea cucullata]|uniref:uncharacterized protein LOC134232280 n=1 Tax=Saccostrea cuccullata TaxID=36930 RepID=UPI002ED62A2B